MRWFAAQALGNIGTPDGVEPLKEALKDPDEGVRDTAFSALAKVCTKLSIKIYP